MVEMFDDRIEITNPGGLPRGLTPEDFGKKSVLRNPNIANLLHRIGYIEKMGTGISKMRKLIAEAELPPIKFEFGTFFTITFIRPQKTTQKTTQKILNLIKENPSITRKRLSELLGITPDGIKYHLNNLKKKELIRRIGGRKGGYWRIIGK